MERTRESSLNFKPLFYRLQDADLIEYLFYKTGKKGDIEGC